MIAGIQETIRSSMTQAFLGGVPFCDSIFLTTFFNVLQLLLLLSLSLWSVRFVLGPALAIDSTPGPVCFKSYDRRRLCCRHSKDGDYEYSLDVILMLMMLKKHENDNEEGHGGDGDGDDGGGDDDEDDGGDADDEDEEDDDGDDYEEEEDDDDDADVE
ncbi:hypothetical protein AK812_SmicGene18695 [Symbiodinium microadriaticum]|uniref:Uncharacterized protein n=1 Tax=Symbiodinium microadriaticum TaxID=2951 RepID=A0A1Q9DUH6_SYMMI|nr:hypothetical protein AK812_SmicGene18695 [Symbiodinium microadriaticum]